jgi:hypothetical protein
MLTTRALALFAVVTLAACGSAAAPSATPGPQPTERPTPTPVIGDPGTGGNGGGGIDPGSGGGSGSGGGTGSGNTGGGIVIPIPGDPNQNPLFGEATYVTPAQGLVDQRQVNVQLVRAVVNDDGSVTADLRWWSGVAPCNQLDHVEIDKDDDAKTIRLKVIEGSGKGDMACIDIAQLKATQVDLGDLAAGAWKISAETDAPEIALDVP